MPYKIAIALFYMREFNRIDSRTDSRTDSDSILARFGLALKDIDGKPMWDDSGNLVGFVAYGRIYGLGGR